MDHRGSGGNLCQVMDQKPFITQLEAAQAAMDRSRAAYETAAAHLVLRLRAQALHRPSRPERAVCCWSSVWIRSLNPSPSKSGN